MATVHVTVPPDSADRIARRLVEERLAACVNRIDCRSVYRWEGSVHEADEELLVVKTTAEAVDALVDRIEALHPYDVPVVERFDETDATSATGAWRERTVDPSAD